MGECGRRRVRSLLGHRGREWIPGWDGVMGRGHRPQIGRLVAEAKADGRVGMTKWVLVVCEA